MGAEYLTRETNRSAKAGNLNHALMHSQGEFILFLDCDHVPTAEILQRTLGYFLEDAKVFLVQTPHFFVNAAPAEKAIGSGAPVPDESEMFYRVIHPGLDSWNASYFCGSAAVMRRTSSWKWAACRASRSPRTPRPPSSCTAAATAACT